MIHEEEARTTIWARKFIGNINKAPPTYSAEGDEMSDLKRLRVHLMDTDWLYIIIIII